MQESRLQIRDLGLIKLLSDNKVKEFECFSKILEYYEREIVGHENIEIPISFLLIKLMKILKETVNKTLVTKALLITISFFGNFPADLYDNRGIEIDLLPTKYRKKAISLLRQEFLLN